MRRPRLQPGVVVFAVAAALRVGWALIRWRQAGAGLEFDDEHLHWQLATNLVGRGLLVSDDGRCAARMPLYPLLLSSFAWLGAAGVLLARLAQALLGAAAAGIICALADRALGRRAAWVAGTLACLDPYAIFFSSLLLSEVPFTLIAVGLGACAWASLREPVPAAAQTTSRRRPARGPERRTTAGLALLGAAAVLTRPAAIGWVALLWLLLCASAADRARAARRVALCAALLALALLPWGLRNRALLGSFAWLSTNGGVTLYDGQGPQARGDSDQSFLRRMPELAGLNEVQRDRLLRRLALEQMGRDPGRVLRLARVKFLRTWSLLPNLPAYRAPATALASVAFMLAVLPAAAVGLWRTRRRWRLHAVLWLPVLYFTLLHCVFVGSLRYRVPLMPFLEISAAAAFVARRAGPD